jgi:hypothetical protein
LETPCGGEVQSGPRVWRGLLFAGGVDAVPADELMMGADAGCSAADPRGDPSQCLGPGSGIGIGAASVVAVAADAHGKRRERRRAARRWLDRGAGPQVLFSALHPHDAGEFTVPVSDQESEVFGSLTHVEHHGRDPLGRSFRWLPTVRVGEDGQLDDGPSAGPRPVPDEFRSRRES